MNHRELTAGSEVAGAEAPQLVARRRTGVTSTRRSPSIDEGRRLDFGASRRVCPGQVAANVDARS